MKVPIRPTTDSQFQDVREYEKGYRDGHKVGHADRLIGLRSGLYWSGRDCTNPYEQGYNDGYVSREETVTGAAVRIAVAPGEAKIRSEDGGWAVEYRLANGVGYGHRGGFLTFGAAARWLAKAITRSEYDWRRK